MSFVFPALLAGTVLAGIPILLHLILRQKPRTLPFPAFRFLVARQQSNRRKLQLRHWLLLALRMSLIAILVAAIARPRLLQQNLGLSSERPVAAVFVIDVSASMDARSSDNRSRLDDAKKRALELLDELPAGSRVAVLSSSDSRGDWLANPHLARQRIQNFKIQYASPPLPRSVIAACRLMGDVANKRDDDSATRLPRLLCVFSDTTRGSWNRSQDPQVLEASDLIPVPREALLDAKADIAAVLPQIKEGPLKDLLPELRDTLPRLTPTMFPLSERPLQLVQQTRTATRDLLKSIGASPGSPKDDAKDKLAGDLRGLLSHLTGYQTIWFDVGLDPPRDLAIVDLEWPVGSNGAPQESVRPGEKILLRPVLQALGQDFQATLSAGAVKEIREVKAGARLGVPIEIDAAAQKLGIGFHPLEFSVNVRDALAIDNQRYATLAVKPPRHILVIAPKTVDDDDVELFRLNPYLDVRVDVATPEAAAAGIAPKYDAAILFAVPQPSDTLWQALAKFVAAGGGLGVFPGYDDMNVDAYRTVAAQTVLPAAYEKAVRLANPGELGTNWDWRPGVYRHPLLQPFERWLVDPGMDFVKFPPRVFAFWETKNAAKNSVLIRYRDALHSPALLERKLGAGKVVQFTTPHDVPPLDARKVRKPAWNTYPERSTSFPLVVASVTVRHLTNELENAKVNFLLGREEANVAMRGLAGRGMLTLRGPESGPIVLDEKSPRLSLPQANLPGNYVIQDSGKNALAAFSMNLPPEEVDLTPWPAADVENLFGGGVRVPADRQANLKQLLRGRFSDPIELFPILMVALLVLLAVENLLANRFYRKEQEAV